MGVPLTYFLTIKIKMRFIFTSKYNSLIYSTNIYKKTIICKGDCEGIER